MKKKNKAQIQPPMHYSKEEFINSSPDRDVANIDKGRSQAVTFTLTQQDIRTLDHEIDRAITLGKRNKSKAAIIRMALRALKNSSDEEYLILYGMF
jgi:hypothetical protein